MSAQFQGQEDKSTDGFFVHCFVLLELKCAKQAHNNNQRPPQAEICAQFYNFLSVTVSRRVCKKTKPNCTVCTMHNGSLNAVKNLIDYNTCSYSACKNGKVLTMIFL